MTLYFVEVQVEWKSLEAKVVDKKPSPEHIAVTHQTLVPSEVLIPDFCL